MAPIRSLLTALLFAGSLAAISGCAKPTESSSTPPTKVTATSAREESPKPANQVHASVAADDEQSSQGPITTDVRAEPDEEPEIVELALAGGAGGRPADISFDDLKVKIDPSSRFEDSMLTEKIKAYDGKPIRIRGVMWPTFQQRGIKQFILLMNQECKFGSAKDPVWCNIRVNLDEDETANFTLKPVTVEGVLHLDVMKGPKYDLSIYEMKAAKVIP